LQIDQSTLTGESREVSVKAGATLNADSVVRQGEATGVVTTTGACTYYGRTTHLVESAHPKLHVEESATRVAKWLFVEAQGATVFYFPFAILHFSFAIASVATRLDDK
jgi:cation transport ATPase